MKTQLVYAFQYEWAEARSGVAHCYENSVDVLFRSASPGSSSFEGFLNIFSRLTFWGRAPREQRLRRLWSWQQRRWVLRMSVGHCHSNILFEFYSTSSNQKKHVQTSPAAHPDDGPPEGSKDGPSRTHLQGSERSLLLDENSGHGPRCEHLSRF